jgi:ubiquinone/menaquinone biosynthesis C-methylase UbiE
MMSDFYTDTVRRLLADGTLHTDMRVLVVAGGAHDREAWLACGVGDVVISNVDARMRGDEFAPYAWSFQDAEALTYADGEFDVCVCHNGLHHCASPHRALLEMYRVARLGVLFFEPLDSPLTRLGVRLNLGQEYEHAAVFDNDMRFGGVRNTEIPNYVYRWTPAEVRKVVQCFAPVGTHRIRFFYATRAPWGRLRLLRNKAALVLAALLLPLVRLAGAVYPGIANNFAALVLKPAPDALFPWIARTPDGGVALRREWLTRRYAKP